MLPYTWFTAASRDYLVHKQYSEHTYIFSSWKYTSTGGQVLDVMILLPSGAKNDITDVLVLEDGMVLLLAIAWPAALSDLNILIKIAQMHDNDPNTSSRFVDSIL